MSGRILWATMASFFALLSFTVGCAVGAHLEDDYITIDKTDLDKQSQFCAEQAEKAYQGIYRQHQVRCSIEVRAALCPTGETKCLGEAVTFCRIATQLELLQFVGDCLETPHFLETHETYL